MLPWQKYYCSCSNQNYQICYLSRNTTALVPIKIIKYVTLVEILQLLFQSKLSNMLPQQKYYRSCSNQNYQICYLSRNTTALVPIKIIKCFFIESFILYTLNNFFYFFSFFFFPYPNFTFLILPSSSFLILTLPSLFFLLFFNLSFLLLPSLF